MTKGKKLNYANEELTLKILKNIDDTKSQHSLTKELGIKIEFEELKDE